MLAVPTKSNNLTTGDIARLTGAPTWAVRQAIDRGAAAATRVGLYRVIDAIDLPAVVAALAKAGYPPEGRAI
jgi:hypothetical protein